MNTTPTPQSLAAMIVTALALADDLGLSRISLSLNDALEHLIDHHAPAGGDCARV